MKSLRFLILCCLPFVSFSQKIPTWPTQPDTVIIYPQQALIRSMIPIQLPAGKSTFFVSGLGTSLQPNSIQATAHGPWRILSVTLEAAEAIRPGAALQDSILRIEKDIRKLEMQIRVTEQQEKIILANAEIKGEADGLIPEDFKEFMTLFEQKLTDIGKKRLSLHEQLIVAENKKKQWENQGKASVTPSQTNQVLRILAETTQEMSTSLSLGYVVDQASWTPHYTARVQDTQQPLSVTFQADIQQQTGLDWTKAHIILSTARPVLGGLKPVLQPEFIQVRQPMVYTRKSARIAPETAMMAMSDAEVAAPPASSVLFENQDLYMQYELPGFQRIPSSSQPTRLDVQAFQWQPKYTYSLVPRQSTDGFVQAELSPDLFRSLLSGSMTLFWRGTYLGESFLDTQWKEEPTAISLGRDQSLQAKMEEVAEKKSMRTIGSSVRETQVYRYTLTNRRNQAIQVKVEDQIPVSQDSRIEITYELSPEAKIVPETGLASWEVNIPAGGTIQIEKTIQLKYPKGLVWQRVPGWN